MAAIAKTITLCSGLFGDGVVVKVVQTTSFDSVGKQLAEVELSLSVAQDEGRVLGFDCDWDGTAFSERRSVRLRLQTEVADVE